MKKLIAIISIVLMTMMANSQGFNVSNTNATGSYTSWVNPFQKHFKWTIENLSVTESNGKAVISYNIYHVIESEYVEVPNDTVRYKFNGTFTKLTKKDSSEVIYDLNDYDKKYYTVSIRKCNGTNLLLISIHYQHFYGTYTYDGYSVSFFMSQDEYNKLIGDVEDEDDMTIEDYELN